MMPRPGKDDMEFPHFDFVIEKMTKAQADDLLDVIIAYVESLGLDMGGGFVMEAEDEQR